MENNTGERGHALEPAFTAPKQDAFDRAAVLICSTRRWLVGNKATDKKSE
jgi:hypothetical protein